MTITEFSQSIYYDQIQYLKTSLDKTILNWLILKNKYVSNEGSISYRLKYGTYLLVEGDTDTIFELTNLFQSRGLNYELRGTKCIEVRIEDFIRKLI